MLTNLFNKKSFILTGLLVMLATSAFAFVAPVQGDIMFKVYDLLINDMINKGVTYIVGFLGLCVAAYFIMQAKIMPGVFAIIGGIMFLSAGAITTAFGLLF